VPIPRVQPAQVLRVQIQVSDRDGEGHHSREPRQLAAESGAVQLAGYARETHHTAVLLILLVPAGTQDLVEVFLMHTLAVATVITLDHQSRESIEYLHPCAEVRQADHACESCSVFFVIDRRQPSALQLRLEDMGGRVSAERLCPTV